LKPKRGQGGNGENQRGVSREKRCWDSQRQTEFSSALFQLFAGGANTKSERERWRKVL